MASPVPWIVSECDHLIFDVHGVRHCFPFESAKGFVLRLLQTSDKASLIFTNIIACRSTVIKKVDGNLKHEQTIWCAKSPFDTEQFLQIMNYHSGVLNDAWHQHLESIKPLANA